MRNLTPDNTTHDPYMALVMAADAGFMRLYRAGRRNARRSARLALVLFPLVVLLVGSCKGVSTAGSSQNVLSQAEQVRAALFPDRAITATRVRYEPAAGYVSTARDFVAHAPATLQYLTEREVSYLFGTPVMTRRDAEARVVQYRGGPCVVDFYFYEPDGGRGAPVSHVDMRRRDGAAPDAACVRDVISHRSTSSGA